MLPNRSASRGLFSFPELACMQTPPPSETGLHTASKIVGLAAALVCCAGLIGGSLRLLIPSVVRKDEADRATKFAILETRVETLEGEVTRTSELVAPLPESLKRVEE